MMLAQRKYQEEVRSSVSVSIKRGRKKSSLLATIVDSQMACVLVVAFVACLFATMYVGAYAGCNEKGRNRAKLVSELTRLKKENEKLRLDIVELRQPERIEMFAKEAKMKPCQETAYLGPIDSHVAQNTASINIR